MPNLFVQTEQLSVPIDLSSLTTTPGLTLPQFYAFCRTNPDLRIERSANGEIMVMPPTFSDTGNRNGRVFGQLFVWAEADGTGEVFDSSTGFTLPNGAVRSPDAAWIQGDRWQALTPDQQASFAPIAPNFVVELRSRSDSLETLQMKLQEYIENGVQLGLLIDRIQRQVHCYRPNCEPEILDQPEFVTCDPELPGFSLKMARIW